jgi:hypothetical protein
MNVQQIQEIQHCDLIYIAEGIRRDLTFFREKSGYPNAAAAKKINI